LIIRIARTFPRKRYNGIGLSAYYLQKLSNQKNIIFTKKLSSKYFKLKKKNHLIEIDYKDLNFSETNGFNFILILLSKIYGELNFFLKIYFHIKSKNYSPKLIHLHSINYFLTAALLKNIYKIPLFINFSGSDFYRLKKLKILPIVVKTADKVFNVSKKIHSDLIRNYSNNKKFFYTSNGINTNIFKNLNFKRKKQFVAVGNLRWQKNYSKILNAFAIFSKKRLDYKLLIIGEGDEKEKLKLEIKKLKLDKKVILCGYIGHKQIAKIVSESCIYLMSSVSEGLPKSLMESIACGTPVITTNAGDCGLVAKDCGIVLSVKCKNETFADSIYKMISNKALWKKYKDNCLKNSNNYSWEKYCKNISKFY
jgi:glycosyltransferase involved in cell wall biosynthesis